MLNSTINKKSEYGFTDYYLNCDLINKYNLKNLHCKPYLKQMTLDLNLDTIHNSYMSKSSVNIESIKVKSIVLLYALTGVLPYINFNKIKILKENSKSLYSVKILFSNRYEMYAFLHDLDKKLFDEKLTNLSKKINSFESDFFIFNIVLNANFLFEFENILNKYVKNLNSKDLKFNFKIFFSNTKKIKSKVNLIKNYIFF